MSALVSRLAAACVLAGVLLRPCARAHADDADPSVPAQADDDAGPSLPAQADDPGSSDAMPSSLPEDPTLRADDEAGPPLRFELNFVGALGYRPSADSGGISYGFGVTYGMGWGDIPLTLGLNFFSLNTNNHVSTLTFVPPGDAAVVLGNQRARERTMHFDLWLRVQPAHWAVRPYVEGFWGAQLVQTQYSLRLPEDPAASDTISDQSWVMSYGWGAGVDFWGLFNANHTVSLTLGVRQFFGGDAGFRRSVLIGDASVQSDYPYNIKGFVFMVGLVSVFDMGVPRDPYEPHRFN